MAVLGIGAITTLSILSFERYLIITKPFRKISLTQHGVTILLLGVWLYSLLLTVPPLIGWGNYIKEGINISCSVNWEDQSYNSKTYIIFLFVFGLVIPLFIITYSYSNIIFTIQKKTAQSKQVKGAEKRIAALIFIMIIAFVIAWSPYAIMALFIQFGNRNLITPSIAVIPALMAKSSICYNPIIYVALNTQFQHSWNQLFCRNIETSVHSRSTTLHEDIQVGTDANFECIEIKGSTENV
ncbi:hypothetical protein RN001_002955 [Aquatica leii]|uniref:G-protein coupled receptors family 1 profile domain-containing protein n=1 Tax=Aquatica leii TaxID=1421715 RepID=A0AAN7Q5T7_9COLE|nr:hypothetical protein RN001_002955 [Aquatica leii]